MQMEQPLERLIWGHLGGSASLNLLTGIPKPLGSAVSCEIPLESGLDMLPFLLHPSWGWKIEENGVFFFSMYRHKPLILWCLSSSFSSGCGNWEAQRCSEISQA